ncbi:MAG: hypothetical protein ACRDCT_22595 [Shewanella sp.]|uniref:hypothetical protein n=1 Tax=Aeromonas veronii TaxID=654 RepID=UPI00330909EB|nr:hypothetical protein [Aeromonas veronii]
MAIEITITKIMSDGWTIIENFTPSKGLNNKYLYLGEPAPSVIMTDKISEQYGAYSLIEKDLRSVVFWLQEIENLKPDDLDRLKKPEKMNLVKGLFVAALTFYAKCFTSCEGRRVKLDKSIFDTDDLKTHERIMKLRHNFAAHSGAEGFEEVKVSLALHPNIESNMKPNLYSELFQPDYISGEQLAFKALAEKLRGIVFEKRDSVGDRVLEKIVKPKGKQYWYEQAKINDSIQPTANVSAD